MLWGLTKRVILFLPPGKRRQWDLEWWDDLLKVVGPVSELQFQLQSMCPPVRVLPSPSRRFPRCEHQSLDLPFCLRSCGGIRAERLLTFTWKKELVCLILSTKLWEGHWCNYLREQSQIWILKLREVSGQHDPQRWCQNPVLPDSRASALSSVPVLSHRLFRMNGNVEQHGRQSPPMAVEHLKWSQYNKGIEFLILYHFN